MSIIYRILPPQITDQPVATVRIVGEKSIAEFQTLVRRSLNCWPDASAELKEFGDMVDHGQILQDYNSQK